MNAETKVKAAAGISAALVKALSEIEGVTKDKVNPHFKSKYADLASVLDTVRPVLAKYDMAVTQETSPSEEGVIVETVVLHASGEERRFGKLYVPANKRDAQGAGSALTYARRYSLLTAFGVPTEDDDGNAAVATARPTTGEAPPEKRVKLDGPYTSKTALWKAVREFDRTLRGMGDSAEFEAFLQTDEVVELLDQCKRDAPQLLDTGEGLPEEYEPLLSLIKRLRHELANADESWRTNPIMAG
jgi:hypothetical protein